jgi:hypothetical protein
LRAIRYRALLRGWAFHPNKAFIAQGKLTMPMLAVGGERSFGPTMAVVMRAAATDVHELVIAGSGHWLMEEQPDATVAAVQPSSTSNGDGRASSLCVDRTAFWVRAVLRVPSRSRRFAGWAAMLAPEP